MLWHLLLELVNDLSAPGIRHLSIASPPSWCLKLVPWGEEGHGGRQGGANVIMPCRGGLDEGMVDEGFGSSLSSEGKEEPWLLSKSGISPPHLGSRDFYWSSGAGDGGGAMISLFPAARCGWPPTRWAGDGGAQADTATPCRGWTGRTGRAGAWQRWRTAGQDVLLGFWHCLDKSEKVNITVKFAWILLQSPPGGRVHCTAFFFYNNKDTTACFI